MKILGWSGLIIGGFIFTMVAFRGPMPLLWIPTALIFSLTIIYIIKKQTKT